MDVSIEFTSLYKKLLSHPFDLPSGQDHPPAAVAHQHQLVVPTCITTSTNKYSQCPPLIPSPHPSPCP
eukprot:1188156-Ditylum_brightwellii.AAC.1